MLIAAQIYLLLALLFVQPISSFYIPGVAPREYFANELVDVKVAAHVCPT